uniref:Uncharacterized protein n=1 Tax=Sphaerodactylus townsendi TaxID=933632 RepID=A0ACB8EIT0_9SAUR
MLIKGLEALEKVKKQWEMELMKKLVLEKKTEFEKCLELREVLPASGDAELCLKVLSLEEANKSMQQAHGSKWTAEEVSGSTEEEGDPVDGRRSGRQVLLQMRADCSASSMDHWRGWTMDELWMDEHVLLLRSFASSVDHWRGWMMNERWMDGGVPLLRSFASSVDHWRGWMMDEWWMDGGVPLLRSFASSVDHWRGWMMDEWWMDGGVPLLRSFASQQL